MVLSINLKVREQPGEPARLPFVSFLWKQSTRDAYCFGIVKLLCRQDYRAATKLLAFGESTAKREKISEGNDQLSFGKNNEL